jgi:hypothetical protein
MSFAFNPFTGNLDVVPAPAGLVAPYIVEANDVVRVAAKQVMVAATDVQVDGVVLLDGMVVDA